MPPPHPPTHLAVFAKYWEPREVKTRLAATVGDNAASAIHREFLHVLLHRMRHQAARRTLVYWPPQRQPEIQEAIPREWGMECQSNGDLGQKLSHFLKSRFESANERILVLGADSPDLPEARIEEAFRRLESTDVVLGPATDGGYYLVGMNSFVPIFADIAWGTTSVFAQTVGQLKRIGATFAELDVWEDVDDWHSLQSLQLRLQKHCEDPSQLRLLARLQSILDKARK